ncbi:uncharacterized protein FSUBG_4968 [Fusarium subglutinans]|uniref:Luciferase domain-containing protein n=1 Tax=Gibberella subglutinans TaxID=42677 RepID=A0A8H5Q5I7_GIBSU|nr:uncharacterized protein FSUBG_4968 [Fusarium subglutinans]KAF5607866.1 hypothetical protein FSUBG_4968 [Fusarium subglutinans]
MTLSQLNSILRSFPNLTPQTQRLAIAAAAGVIIGIPAFRLAAEDYRGYLALGPGGPPHNLIGWVGQILLKPLKKEPFHTSCYTDKACEKAGPNGHVAFLTSSSLSKLKIAISLAERRGPALFVASEKPSHPIAKRTGGEIGHMHGSDGSMHINLAPKDAKLVLEKGWGQRHPLSGTVLYLGNVMVYAPRNEAELEVVKSITRAGVKFILGEELSSPEERD